MQPKWLPGSARGKSTSGICEVTISFGEHEVQNGEIKKIEFVELLNMNTVEGGLIHSVEKGYERISKKYRSLNDITIEFDN